MSSDDQKEKCTKVKDTVGKLSFCTCQEFCFLGGGGFGEVFRGLYDNDRRKVAVKRVTNDNVTIMEAEILCDVDTHDNILRYYGTEKALGML